MVPVGILPQWLVENPFVVFNILLSIISIFVIFAAAVLSYQSYIVQAQVSVRNALEQLDDVYIKDGLKMKVLIYEFQYGICNFRNPKTTLHFKFHEHESHLETVSIPLWKSDEFTKPGREYLEYYLEEKEEVEEIGIGLSGVHVEVASKDPLVVRSVAEKATEQLQTSVEWSKK